jgi:hypothetical protein
MRELKSCEFTTGKNTRSRFQRCWAPRMDHVSRYCNYHTGVIMQLALATGISLNLDFTIDLSTLNHFATKIECLRSAFGALNQFVVDFETDTTRGSATAFVALPWETRLGSSSRTWPSAMYNTWNYERVESRRGRYWIFAKCFCRLVWAVRVALFSIGLELMTSTSSNGR